MGVSQFRREFLIISPLINAETTLMSLVTWFMALVKPG